MALGTGSRFTTSLLVAYQESSVAVHRKLPEREQGNRATSEPPAIDARSIVEEQASVHINVRETEYRHGTSEVQDTVAFSVVVSLNANTR